MGTSPRKCVNNIPQPHILAFISMSRNMKEQVINKNKITIELITY